VIDTALPRATPLRWQNARIIGILPQTPTVKSFMLTPDKPFAFRAGQHVDIRLTAPDGYQAQRSYSIASAPETFPIIELAIERLDDGEVSPFFHEVAAIGDEIEIRGPIGGHFIWQASDPGPILLVGGGSGVAPLMSMLRHRAASGAKTLMTLLFSVRHWEDVIFREELLELDDRGDGFNLVFALTRENTRRETDYPRRIDMPMMREVLARLPSPPVHTFVCGSNPFVETASEAIIAAGIAPPSIRTERYGA